MPSLIRDRSASSPAMLAAFGDEALLDAALRFEAALAQAQADVGVIDQASAAEIVAACAERPEIESLAEAAAHAGTLAIPLVALIRARIADPAIARQVHKGATSQDLADTALLLQAKAGAALVVAESRRLAQALAVLAERHAASPMLGRTLLQGALPITFGLKVAGWLQGVTGALARFERETAAIRLQLGGATGSLTGLDGQAFAVVARLAERLDLPAAETPWHARREGLAGLGASLAILTGAVGKIAGDLALLAQGEVAEAFEPRVEGRGGSSAMAHKRNPTGCQVALSAAIRAPHLAAALITALPQQQHERGLGGWQAEGPVLAELFQLTHGALSVMAPVIEGLEVHADRMVANLAAADVGIDTGESEALVAAALAAYGKTC
ncbi:3-carboxy-cis,cis-muconate cycloisomerase [Caulobacter segnis]|uniref:3-carboxy-cis,cis-muconate cycloisomerase n=1 Tax=Caulobacter segnis TaxID=88688 RepID=A0A2W5UXM1_9CAUL|nr:3-carboxy-cis,cis-muconate cycloisomerase [Caulobacter segnis]PZR32420.1 MAG: 3-carboxy-cis,cis-muconate cycloisomerase [Caulobacter segnis]